MKSGIYAIRNVTNGKAYVGSAVDLSRRRRQHFDALRSGTHYNSKLQRAWGRYGESGFAFEVLEVVSERGELIAREQHWIDALDSVGIGYNLNPTAGSFLGRKHTEATRIKMASARTGVPVNEAARKKISDANRGRRQSEAQRTRHSGFMTGRKPSAEHLAAQVAALRRPEVRAKISATSKGRPRSAETLAKHRAAMRSPEVQAKLKARAPTMLGATQSDSTRDLIRARAQARWADPVLRAKYVQARRDRAQRESS